VNRHTLWLCAGYFTYFGALGIYAPFWSPYLSLRGFDAVDIGLLIALPSAARAIVPMGLGWLADVTRRPTAILRMTALLAAIAFALFPFVSGLAAFAVLAILFGAFWNAVIPLYDSHTLSHLGEQSAHYGRLRLWGSVGFIVVSTVAGGVLQRAGYSIVPWMAWGLMLATFLVCMRLHPVQSPPARSTSRGLGTALRSRTVAIPLLVSTLVVMSCGAYYAFFTLWLEMNGYSRLAIGVLWAIGVMAEVVVFAIGSHLLARFSLRTLFVAAAAGSAVRWAAVGLGAAHPLLIGLSQVLHCLSFAVLHFAMVLTAHREFPRDLANSGQTLFSSVAYGVGGLLGALLAGVIWAAFSPQASYVCAAFIVVLATFCAAAGLRDAAPD
jgi:PPP family 3-phenylpropionic acid transporter